VRLNRAPGNTSNLACDDARVWSLGAAPFTHLVEEDKGEWNVELLCGHLSDPCAAPVEHGNHRMFHHLTRAKVTGSIGTYRSLTISTSTHAAKRPILYPGQAVGDLKFRSSVTCCLHTIRTVNGGQRMAHEKYTHKHNMSALLPICASACMQTEPSSISWSITSLLLVYVNQMWRVMAMVMQSLHLVVLQP